MVKNIVPAPDEETAHGEFIERVLSKMSERDREFITDLTRLRIHYDMGLGAVMETIDHFVHLKNQESRSDNSTHH